ncbi:hydrogenase expression/formation protein HypE [Candidatus Woesearchaeota archaeon]|nr:hydrogenase expression/formation protein HypE [Candidatus Woesearchaeota archaeon]
MDKDIIKLAHGSGGKEMNELIKKLGFSYRGRWQNFDDDSATFEIGKKHEQLVFTTDTFTVTPIFFPGGNIGHIAFSGTVNDLLMMGAKPLGLSLGIVIEEGFPKEELQEIIGTIKAISEKTKIPIVTGDTKVMEKGKLDKIIINTSGIGIAKRLLAEKPIPGDKIIISGGIGEHAIALLSKRFNYETTLITDSKPLVEEINSVKCMIKVAKDPTRGGIAAILNDISEKHNVGILIEEEKIPMKEEVKNVSEMLGIDPYELACEGRFVCIASKENAGIVEKKLKQFNKDAGIVGEITDDNKVILQTILGKRILSMPSGRIVPRIC